MESRIDSIAVEALEAISVASSLKEIRIIETKYLGRRGLVTQFLRSISSLPNDDRPLAGKRANDVKKIIKVALSKALSRSSNVSDESFYNDAIDLSLPGRRRVTGHLHPITKINLEICDIFTKIGFKVIDGPEIETDYYNFEALNLPKNHPARDMQDTFYVSDNVVLRTHTSSSQPRIMEIEDPPIHVLSPGKVYRCDSDITHTPMFHQIEGLFVDCNVSFGDLKGVISIFVRKMFGNSIKMRFRPSFFPFTEPSAEVDIACVICNSKGCKVCSNTGWLEVLGSGMVHSNVFKRVGYNTSKYSGFAFGMGVERIAMLKYRVDDIRKYFENDFRFLSQF